MRTLLQKILIGLARAHIGKYKPMIIGVTGNAGKTSTKEAIAAVIGRVKKVRIAGGNLNNEFGLPLTILGNWDDEYYEKGPTPLFWVKVILVGILGLIHRDCPEVFLLEYGADKPGDIKRLVSKFKPHIAVVTTVGDVPVHIEFFKDAEAVANEKSNLIKFLGAGDYAVINHDDDRVLDMKDKTKAHVLTFGFEEGCDIKASDLENLTENEKPGGVTFKLHYGGSFVPVRINGSLGRSQAYSSGAAAAVGVILGMNLVEISDALSEYRGPKGRLKILKGIKNSVIIDDTYNASPSSTRLALETLKSLPAGRKIAVLGDMLELGEYTEQAHRVTGNFAGSFADILVTVGVRAKFIADSARRILGEGGFGERLFCFNTSTEAKMKVKELIKEGDLVLVKGSQGMRMEKIVEEIMAEPEKAKELLVRQSTKWLAK